MIVFTGNLYIRLGRRLDAEKLLWREFERSADFDLYKKMKAMFDTGGETSVSDRAVASLKARLAKPVKRSPPHEASLPDILIQLLIHERLFDEAWATAGSHGGSEYILMALAEVSEATHPDEASKIHAGHVERIIRLGGQRNYEDACALIERIGRLRARLGEADAHAAWLDDLAHRHKAKRNFLKLLRR